MKRIKAWRAVLPRVLLPLFIIILTSIGHGHAGEDDDIPYASLAKKLMDDEGDASPAGMEDIGCYASRRLNNRIQNIYKLNPRQSNTLRPGFTNPFATGSSLPTKTLTVNIPHNLTPLRLALPQSLSDPLSDLYRQSARMSATSSFANELRHWERMAFIQQKSMHLETQKALPKTTGQLRPTKFLDYINKPTSRWYPVGSMGIPGGWGAKPLPGERIFVHFDDPIAWAPTWRNITPMPTMRSRRDPVYKGEAGIGLTLLHLPLGSGSPRKSVGIGGHGLESYEQMAPPLRADRIRVHSQAGPALYNVHAAGGWQDIERFQGKTLLGAGHSPADARRNQIATGGYWSNFTLDVATRAIPWSLGIQVGNPLRMDSTVGFYRQRMISSRQPFQRLDNIAQKDMMPYPGLKTMLSSGIHRSTFSGNQFLKVARNPAQFNQRMNYLNKQGYNIIGNPMSCGTYVFSRYQDMTRMNTNMQTRMSSFQATNFANNYLSGAPNSAAFAQRMGTLTSSGFNIIGNPMSHGRYIFNQPKIGMPQMQPIKMQPIKPLQLNNY